MMAVVDQSQEDYGIWQGSLKLNGRLRELRGYRSQRDFVAHLNAHCFSEKERITLEQYQRWEFGDLKPTIGELRSLAIGLRVPTDWLLFIERGSLEDTQKRVQQRSSAKDHPSEETLRNRLAEQDEYVRTLESRLGQAEGDLAREKRLHEEFKASSERWEGLVEVQRQDLDRLKLEVARLEGDLGVHEAVKRDARVQELSQEVDRLQALVEERAGTIERLNQTIDADNRKISELVCQIRNIPPCDPDGCRINDERLQLRDDVADLERDLEQRDEQIQSLEADIQARNDQVTALSKKLWDVEHNLGVYTRVKAQEEVQTLEAEVARLSEELEAREADIERQKAVLARLKSSLEQEANRYEQRGEELDELAGENRELRDLVARQESEWEDQTSEVEALEEAQAELQEQCDQYQARIEALETELQEAKAHQKPPQEVATPPPESAPPPEPEATVSPDPEPTLAPEPENTLPPPEGVPSLLLWEEDTPAPRARATVPNYNTPVVLYLLVMGAIGYGLSAFILEACDDFYAEQWLVALGVFATVHMHLIFTAPVLRFIEGVCGKRSAQDFLEHMSYFSPFLQIIIYIIYAWYYIAQGRHHHDVDYYRIAVIMGVISLPLWVLAFLFLWRNRDRLESSEEPDTSPPEPPRSPSIPIAPRPDSLEDILARRSRSPNPTPPPPPEPKAPKPIDPTLAKTRRARKALKALQKKQESQPKQPTPPEKRDQWGDEIRWCFTQRSPQPPWTNRP